MTEHGAMRLFAALTVGAFAASAVSAATAGASGLSSGPVAQAAPSEPTGPTAITGAAEPISPQSATVEGTVDPHGTDTTFYFQYGTSTSYGFVSTSQDAGAGTEPETVSATLSKLSFGALFHYRIVASSALGLTTGEDRTFSTPDAVLSGRYAVTLTVLRGGSPLGQRAGEVVHRSYRFSAHCHQGLCQTVSLQRRGDLGSFASTLRRHSADHYVGMERVSGRCNDGESYRSTDTISVYPTSVSGSRAADIAGTLRIHLAGCVRGTEIAQLSGRPAAH